MTTAATSNTPWPTVKLGDVCEEIRERISTDVISVEHYITTDNMLKSCGGVKLAESLPPNTSLVHYRQGDILLSNIRPYLKKVWCATFDGGCSSDVIVFRSKREDLSSDYLYQVLSQEDFFSYVMQNVSGTKMPRGKRDWIKEFAFPLPPLEVQREIVAKVEKGLAEADALAAHFKRLAALADELKRPIIQRAIQGMLVEQRQEEGLAGEFYQQVQAEKQRMIKLGKLKKEKPFPEITQDEIPFDIPYSWKWVRLGELGQLKNGYAFKSSEYTEEGVQVVRISDLDEDTVSDKSAVFYPMMEELESYQVVDGSILICMTGSIGKMAWVRDGVLRYLNQRVGMFVATTPAVTPYLWYGLHVDYVIDEWMNSKTSTNGNIRSSDITNLLVPLPPLAEQKRIVEKLDEELAKCERLKAEAERGVKAAEALRKAVLAEAFEQ